MGKPETETGRPTTTDTHASVFSSNPQVYAIKERVLSEIESDCSGKDLWRRLRDLQRNLTAYKAYEYESLDVEVKLFRERKKEGVHYKYYDIDNQKEGLFL